jgi:hypothetical protein
MIIEYKGEVVRPCLTDKREHENEGKVRNKVIQKGYLFVFHRVLVVICLPLIQCMLLMQHIREIKLVLLIITVR